MSHDWLHLVHVWVLWAWVSSQGVYSTHGLVFLSICVHLVSMFILGFMLLCHLWCFTVSCFVFCCNFFIKHCLHPFSPPLHDNLRDLFLLKPTTVLCLIRTEIQSCNSEYSPSRDKTSLIWYRSTVNLEAKYQLYMHWLCKSVLSGVLINNLCTLYMLVCCVQL